MCCDPWRFYVCETFFLPTKVILNIWRHRVSGKGRKTGSLKTSFVSVPGEIEYCRHHLNACLIFLYLHHHVFTVALNVKSKQWLQRCIGILSHNSFECPPWVRNGLFSWFWCGLPNLQMLLNPVRGHWSSIFVKLILLPCFFVEMAVLFNFRQNTSKISLIRNSLSLSLNIYIYTVYFYFLLHMWNNQSVKSRHIPGHTISTLFHWPVCRLV